MTVEWLATVLPPSKVTDSIARRNWEKTPMGRMESWPTVVLSTISVIMNVSEPMCVIWGEERSIIYNDAYAHLYSFPPESVGDSIMSLRKQAFERGGREMVDRVLRGETLRLRAYSRMIKRSDESWEERLFSSNMWPVRNEFGYIEGCQVLFIDITAAILAEERMVHLKRSLEKLMALTSTDQLFRDYPNITSEASKHISYSAIYMLDDAKSVLTRAAVYNLEDTNPALPAAIKVSASNPRMFPVNECFKNKTIMEVHNVSGFSTLPSGQPDNVFAREAILVPFHLATKNDTIRYEGVLVVGVCAHRNLDDGFKEFASLLAGNLIQAFGVIDSFQMERKRVDDFARLDEQKTRFFTSISHEIRAPLSLVLGPIEDCMSSQLEDILLPALPNDSEASSGQASKKEHFIRKMTMAHENAVRIRVLVDRLLDFHKLEAGKMKPRFVQINNLTLITKNTIEIFRSAIEGKGIICDTDRIEEIKDVCVLDIDMWEKILFNLISNAIKFTERGKISFALSRKEKTDEIVFELDDTGPGIPDEEKPLIFTTFFRSKRTATVQGTGIGLSFVKELVTLHNGTVVVSDGASQTGTTVTVRIPRIGSTTTVDDKDVNIPTSASSSSNLLGYIENHNNNHVHDVIKVQTSISNPAKSMRNDTTGMNIMVIDDNSEMRSYVAEILSELWNVHAFRSAEDALDALKDIKIDLIVCDILLPKMSGIEFTHTIRSTESTQDVPVFLLTAKSSEDSRLHGLLSGADDYIIKPFSRRELVSRINTRLELQKLRKELENLVSNRTAQLINEKKKYEHLARASPVALVQLSKEFVPKYFSDKYWSVLGIDIPDDPLNKHLYRVKPEYLPTIFGDLNILLQEKKAVRHEVQFKNGTFLVAEMIPDLDDVTGELVGIIGCLMNITEMKMMEMQRLEAMEEAEKVQRKRADEAEEMKKQKEAFIDMICHEIRNPLSAILSNNELICDSVKTALKIVNNPLTLSGADVELRDSLESIADYSKSITICAKHQKNIADDVLHMSKLSLELVAVNTTDFDTITLVEDLLAAMDPEMNCKKIEWKLTVLEGIETYRAKRIMGDPVRITQVNSNTNADIRSPTQMVNFITNAIKFTSKSDIRTIDVIIDAKPVDSNNINTNQADEELLLTFAIKDSGIGMTEDQLSKLFQKFQQASLKTYDEYGGSGLGLFISKRLIELMGGTVDVLSTPGLGTTFMFSIKAKRYVGPDPVRRCSLEDLMKKSLPKLNAPAEIPKILVVGTYTKQLIKEGFQTEEAINGLEALKKAKEFNYSLILMDVEMPVMDGITAVTKLREFEAESGRNKVPIVSVTGNARAEQIEHYLRMGVQKVLTKPYTRERLLDTVVGMLESNYA
ncbi:hypothetical protein HDU76_009361 [Blyttiomyces sp. JEL0837]|nr:hypothetical protein HDU76_009361 [Blyttiomyces sp. JEL0837]